MTVRLSGWVGVSLFALLAMTTGCGQGNERLAEKARIEGKEQAKAEIQAQIEDLEKKIEIAKAEGRATAQAELQTQLENMNFLVDKARAEGKATSEAELDSQIQNIGKIIQKADAEGRASARAELETQIENMDKLIQKARMEGKASAEADLKAQTDNWIERAQELEGDLQGRHRFYQAVRGVYEGKLQTEEGDFRVRLTLVPSLPPSPITRVRQIDEIVSDINNLYLNVQVMQWRPGTPLSSVGCRVEQIRPDLIQGEITIASENCPNLYALRLADKAMDRHKDGKALATGDDGSDAWVSVALAKEIRAGNVHLVPEILGRVQPTTNASVYSLSVARVSR